MIKCLNAVVDRRGHLSHLEDPSCDVQVEDIAQQVMPAQPGCSNGVKNPGEFTGRMVFAIEDGIGLITLNCFSVRFPVQLVFVLLLHLLTLVELLEPVDIPHRPQIGSIEAHDLPMPGSSDDKILPVNRDRGDCPFYLIVVSMPLFEFVLEF